MFGSSGEVAFDPSNRASQARIKSGNTLKLPAMTADAVRKALPIPQKPHDDHRPTEIVDGPTLLEELTADEPEKPNQLTNEVFESLFNEQDDEDDEPIVPSRPAGEYPPFTPLVIETTPQPSPKTTLTSITAPIQKQRQFISRRTRSILVAAGIGVALGLTGIAAYDYYAEPPNQEKANF